MSFDSFFKELVTTNNEDEQKPVCFCRHPRKGQLNEQPDGSHKFEGECSPDKACFKIQFDCARSLSKNMHILTKTTKVSPKKRREWETRPTLERFFGKDYISRVNKRDIPRPPPPHNVDKPSDS